MRLIRTYWAEIEKVDIFATIRTYWAEVLKDPQLAEIQLHSACFGSVNYFSTLNSLSRVTWGHFSRNFFFFVPKKNFIGVLYNLVDFWSEKCLFPSKQTKKYHLGQLLYINGSLRLIRTYWAEIEKSGHICHYSYVLG